MLQALLANWRWLLPVIGVVTALAWGGMEHAWRVSLERDIAADKLAQQKTIQQVKDEAQALSDELVIEQAKAMAINDNKAVTYVDRIKYIQAPDTACPADERMRLGSRGVSDLIRGSGSPAIGGAPAAVSGPGTGARP
jgi:hypothetical protein